MNSGAIAHTAYYRWSTVNANTDLERLGQFLSESLTEHFYLLDHAHRRRQRLAATFRRAPFDPEQSHDAVADEFVDRTAGTGNALAHRLEIAVQKEHQIVRQFLLGDAGKRAQIGE